MVGGAEESDPIRSRVSIRERHSFEAFSSGLLWDEYPVVVAAVSFQSVVNYLQIPVAQPSGQERLAVLIDEEWDCRSTQSIYDSPIPFPSMILSARNNWTLRKSKVAVFGSATLIDGARRSEALMAGNFCETVVLQIVFGLDETQEIGLRKLIDGETRVVERATYKLDTQAPRLVVKDRWVSLTVDSEPFVVRTVRGYAPAVMVRPDNDQIPHHLLIGAKSLSECIEENRPKGGSIIGLRLKIRKESLAPTSRYIAESLDGLA